MPDEELTLEEMKNLIRDFVTERDWHHFQKPASLALSAAIEIGELLERFQWLRHSEIEELLADEAYKQSIADEIADVLIYLIRLADTTGISLTDAVRSKLKKNEAKYPTEIWRGRIPEKVRNQE